MTYEELVQNIILKHDVPRSKAVQMVIKAQHLGDPRLKAIPDIREGLNKENEYSPSFGTQVSSAFNTAAGELGSDLLFLPSIVSQKAADTRAKYKALVNRQRGKIGKFVGEVAVIPLEWEMLGVPLKAAPVASVFGKVGQALSGAPAGLVAEVARGTRTLAEYQKYARRADIISDALKFSFQTGAHTYLKTEDATASLESAVVFGAGGLALGKAYRVLLGKPSKFPLERYNLKVSADEGLKTWQNFMRGSGEVVKPKDPTEFSFGARVDEASIHTITPNVVPPPAASAIPTAKPKQTAHLSIGARGPDDVLLHYWDPEQKQFLTVPEPLNETENFTQYMAGWSERPDFLPWAKENNFFKQLDEIFMPLSKDSPVFAPEDDIPAFAPENPVSEPAPSPFGKPVDPGAPIRNISPEPEPFPAEPAPIEPLDSPFGAPIEPIETPLDSPFEPAASPAEIPPSLDEIKPKVIFNKRGFGGKYQQFVSRPDFEAAIKKVGGNLVKIPHNKNPHKVVGALINSLLDPYEEAAVKKSLAVLAKRGDTDTIYRFASSLLARKQKTGFYAEKEGQHLLFHVRLKSVKPYEEMLSKLPHPDGTLPVRQVIPGVTEHIGRIPPKKTIPKDVQFVHIPATAASVPGKVYALGSHLFSGSPDAFKEFHAVMAEDFHNGLAYLQQVIAELKLKSVTIGSRESGFLQVTGSKSPLRFNMDIPPSPASEPLFSESSLPLPSNVLARAPMNKLSGFMSSAKGKVPVSVSRPLNMETQSCLDGIDAQHKLFTVNGTDVVIGGKVVAEYDPTSHGFKFPDRKTIVSSYEGMLRLYRTAYKNSNPKDFFANLRHAKTAYVMDPTIPAETQVLVGKAWSLIEEVAPAAAKFVKAVHVGQNLPSPEGSVTVRSFSGDPTLYIQVQPGASQMEVAASMLAEVGRISDFYQTVLFGMGKPSRDIAALDGLRLSALLHTSLVDEERLSAAYNATYQEWLANMNETPATLIDRFQARLELDPAKVLGALAVPGFLKQFGTYLDFRTQMMEQNLNRKEEGKADA